MTLPERSFRHPVARAIIDQRKELARDPRLGRGSRRDPRGSEPAARRCSATTRVVYLGAARGAAAAARAITARTRLPGVSQLLWDTALRIEDGNMSLAERDLRRLQQKLQEALAKGAPDEEIERLMQELREALDRYLQALAEEMRQQPPSRRSSRSTPRRCSPVATCSACSTAPASWRAAARATRPANCCRNCRTCWRTCERRSPAQMQQRGSSEAQQMMRGIAGIDAASAAAAGPQLPRPAPSRAQPGKPIATASSPAGQQQGDQGDAGDQGERARWATPPASRRRCAACSAR